jgi:hypothetical protein
VPGEAPGAEVESCQEFQQIEQHAKKFVYLLLQLNEHRAEWERGTQVRKSVKTRPNKVSNET